MACWGAMKMFRACAVALAMMGCAATGPVEREPAKEAGPGELVVVGEGAAIPEDVRLAVLWGNEDAEPPIVVTPLATTARGDGSLTIAGLPAPPPAMIMRARDVEVALGYLVAYTDRNGDGTLTIAQDKPWRWPEFRGGINRHALVYASAPVREGSEVYQMIGAHPGGLELAHVELTAQCDADACSGHDEMSFGPRPATMTVVLPAEPASYRFPNLD